MNMTHHGRLGKTSVKKEYLTLERYGMVDFITLKNLNFYVCIVECPNKTTMELVCDAKDTSVY